MAREDKAIHPSEEFERGSLSLEHVLFIGAIAGISTGIITFYDSIERYITATAESFAEAPSNLGAQQ